MASIVSGHGTAALSIRPQEVRSVEGLTRLSARVDGPLRVPEFLYYEIESAHLPDASELADPFVLALLFPAMRRGLPLRIEGPVSRSLLANLEYLMGIWALWRPGCYRPVELQAAQEVESAPAEGDGAVALFSGGLDSAFSVLRHHRRLAGRRNRNIEVGVFVHGAEFPPDHANAARFTEACRRMLGSLAIETCVVRTNVREFQNTRWEDCHGAALTSCLHWFANSHRYGIIGATVMADLLNIWGSHPLTDRHLGSDRFEIQDDGALVSRVEKADLVRTWPEAMDELRVCYHRDLETLNCGSCRKCIYTKLAFMACGGEVGRSLEPEASWREVLLSGRIPSWAPHLLARTLATAKERGLSRRAWYRALDVRMRLHALSAPTARLARRAVRAAESMLGKARRRLGTAREGRGRD
jgi:hypothetical protein